MKKILCFLILIKIMFVTWAYDFSYTYQGITLYYNILDSINCEVTYYNQGENNIAYNNLSGSISVPSVVYNDTDSYIVISVGRHAFYGCTAITNVSLPSTIKKIGEGAFYSCSLTSILFPDSIVEIGSMSFYNTKITSVNLSSNIKKIGGSAFSNCDSLHTAFVNAFSSNSVYEYNFDIAIFSGCSNLTYVYLGDSVSFLPQRIFSDCDSLKTITIPKNVKLLYTGVGSFDTVFFNADSCEKSYWSDRIFENGLKTIIFGDNVRYIPSYLLRYEILYVSGENYPFLESIIIPRGVKKIGNDAFGSCNSLKNIYIYADSLLSGGFRYLDSVENLVIGNNVKYIPSHFFEYCKLKTLSIPDSVVTIGSHAFFQNDSLLFVELGQSVRKIDTGAFCGCIALKTVQLGQLLDTIGFSSFEQCINLRTINLPFSLKYIGSQAFSGCFRISPVIIPSSVLYIGRSAFNSVKMIIYDGTATWEYENSRWGALCLNGYVDGDYYYTDENRTQLVGVNYDIHHVEIPSTVTIIGYEAFFHNDSLYSILIPQSVITIENSAFAYCVNIDTLKIPLSVTYIYRYSFTDVPLVDFCGSVWGGGSPWGATRVACISPPVYYNDIYETVCNNQFPYSTQDTLFLNNTQSGVYCFKRQTVDGFDSIVRLHLSVKEVTYGDMYDTIIENDLPYVFNGRSFNGPVQHFMDTVSNVSSCDSVIDFCLHIWHNVTVAVDSTICDSELPFTWNGQVFFNSAYRQATLATIHGSDSIVIMSLTVNPSHVSIFIDTICDNSLFPFADTVFNTEGLHTRHFVNMFGCDSAMTLKLTVRPTSGSFVYDTTCPLYPVYFGGHLRYYSGVYKDTILNMYGCDSVITLFLNVIDDCPIIYDTILSHYYIYSDTVVYFGDMFYSRMFVHSADSNEGVVIGGDGYYCDGETFQLMALAKDGYRFLQWRDGSIDNPRTIFVDEESRSQAFIAQFDNESKCINKTSIEEEEDDDSYLNGKKNIVVSQDTLLIGGETHIRTFIMDTVYQQYDTVMLDENQVFTNVAVQSTNTSMGFVVGGDGRYLERQRVRVVAVPKEGYAFNRWLLDNNTENPRHFYMSSEVANSFYLAEFNGCENEIEVNKQNDIRLTVNHRSIGIEGLHGEDVFLYDLQGKPVFEKHTIKEKLLIEVCNNGVYILEIKGVLNKKIVIGY